MAFDPRGLDFSRWAALTSQLLGQFGYVARTVNEKDWRDWANTIRALPEIAPLMVPDPRAAKTWQEWGFRLSEGLSLLGL